MVEGRWRAGGGLVEGRWRASGVKRGTQVVAMLPPPPGPPGTISAPPGCQSMSSSAPCPAVVSARPPSLEDQIGNLKFRVSGGPEETESAADI